MVSLDRLSVGVSFETRHPDHLMLNSLEIQRELDADPMIQGDEIGLVHSFNIDGFGRQSCRAHRLLVDVFQ
eukprot:747213-Hanusia_phi.AAC.2